MQLNKFTVILSLVFLFVRQADAACASPAANAGQLQWISASSKVMWCDGTSWQDTSNGTVSSCAGVTAGTKNYASGIFSYCDGTNWISMKGSQAGSCAGTSAGYFDYVRRNSDLSIL